MNFHVASNVEGTLIGLGLNAVHPHLVCSWTLDPASRRLSCAWAMRGETSTVAAPSSLTAASSVNA